jgi:hypothetical protein
VPSASSNDAYAPSSVARWSGSAGGCAPVRFHDLRHSFGTLALASGVDLQTVSRALGHESTAITSRIYPHAIESLNEDAAARIDALLGNTVTSAAAEPRILSKPAESVPQPCHPTALPIRNVRNFERFRVAPAGFEPLLGGSGESRPLPIRVIL